MSYPRDLEEYSDYEILLEYRRRAELLRVAKCTYCTKPQTECNCRMKNESGHGTTNGSLPFGYNEWCINFDGVVWPPTDEPKVTLEIMQ